MLEITTISETFKKIPVRYQCFQCGNKFVVVRKYFIKGEWKIAKISKPYDMTSKASRKPESQETLH